MSNLRVVIVSVFLFATLLIDIYLPLWREKRKKAEVEKRKTLALERIDAEIGAKLYNVCVESSWRWICRPDGFETGGMGRIAVRYPCDIIKEVVVDVCITPLNKVELYVANVEKLSAMIFAPPVIKGIKPIDEESTIEWYETVFIGPLTELIDDLTKKDNLCVCIGNDGRVYTGEPGKCAAIYEFDSMPDVSLWEYIIEQLAETNLYTQIWNEKHLFISWA